MLPCQENPDLFFAERAVALESAKALCLGCPVRDLCLAGALERAEPHGVWGGQILVGGAVVATKRGRGRPRRLPSVA
jgi:WhiB family redox-sensing transcriptional regulator